MRKNVLGKLIRRVKNSSYLPISKPSPIKERVFGIGCPRTGTTTLGMCLYTLGFRETGWNEQLFTQVYNGSIDQTLKFAQKYYGFNDLPWCMLYKELDEAFPGSKFILTIRKSTPTWLRSFQSHHKKTFGRVLDDQGLPTSDTSSRIWPRGVSGYEEHNASVLEYFSSRPDDLATLCWEEGDDWNKLCGFLDLPVPGAIFPHLNESKLKK